MQQQQALPPIANDLRLVSHYRLYFRAEARITL